MWVEDMELGAKRWREKGVKKEGFRHRKWRPPSTPPHSFKSFSCSLLQLILAADLCQGGHLPIFFLSSAFHHSGLRLAPYPSSLRERAGFWIVPVVWTQFALTMLLKGIDAWLVVDGGCTFCSFILLETVQYKTGLHSDVHLLDVHSFLSRNMNGNMLTA